MLKAATARGTANDHFILTRSAALLWLVGALTVPASSQAQPTRRTTAADPARNASNRAAASSNTELPTLPKQDFAVRCGALHVGDGRVLENVWLIVRGGKVESFSASADAPEDLPVSMRRTKSSCQALVAADSDLVRPREDRYTITPDVLALDEFDFSRKQRDALSGGVTTVYLAPSDGRLVPGQGAVVKTAGDDIVERVLRETAALHINLSASGIKAPAVFEPGAAPTSDDPLRPARRQVPSSRISQLEALRGAFRDAALQAAGNPDNSVENGAENGTNYIEQFTGSPEDYSSGEAFNRVVAGALPLRVVAREAADVRRGIRFAKELGVRAILDDPFEIGALGATIAAAGIPAVFRVPGLPGRSNPGGEDLANELPTADPKAPGIAAKAGVQIALAPPRGASMTDFLLLTGQAVRHGLPLAKALPAVTLEAAKILGVDSDVGSLEVGKDADFVVLSGAPFAVGTLVESTWIDGDAVWQRKATESLLAVRVGRIMTMAGPVLRNGTLVIDDHRIKAIGEDMAIPYGARVLEIENGVMVPGFIDAFSHLGLSGYGTGVPNGEPDQRIDMVVDAADPMLHDAARTGLTTVLVSGKDSASPLGGRVTALKTGAMDRDALILRKIAAQRMRFTGGGPEAVKAFDAVLQRGKKYLETWQKYEKALADFEAGKKAEKDAPPPEPTESEEEGKADPLSGTWETTIDAEGFTISLVVELKLVDNAVTGTVTLTLGPRTLPPIDITDGSFDGTTFRCTISMMGSSSTIEGKPDGDTMEGSFEAERLGNRPFTATRTAKPAADGSSESTGANSSSAKKKDGPPDAPKVDETLEPLKAVWQKTIPAVVAVSRADAVRDVIELFAKHELPLVLFESRDAVEKRDPILAEKKPAILFGPSVIERKGNEIMNLAARAKEAGLPMAIATGDTAGSTMLPMHAAFAVRYGLGSEDALAAITIEPAKMFKLDDRIGSLATGKDADFVVFDGNPLEVTSQVVLVVVGGRVVFDARTEEDGK